MKIRGVILSTCAMVVFFAAYAMAHEPEPIEVSSAKPVMVPYLNKTINEVNYGRTDATDGYPEEIGQDGEETGQASDDLHEGTPGTVLTNAGRVETGEDADTMPELVGGESDNPVLTYLGTYAATAYCSCSECTGIYATGYTASGTWATEGRTIACNTLPMGTQVYIEGYGYYTVEDTGYTPYGDAWLDIFFESHDSALAFGVRQVEVYMVN